MDQEVIEYLNSLTGADEAARVTTYTVWIEARELLVKVYDRGEGFRDIRYSVWADWAQPDPEVLSRGGSTHSMGNPAATLASAIDNVHWWQFSRKSL